MAVEKQKSDLHLHGLKSSQQWKLLAMGRETLLGTTSRQRVQDCDTSTTAQQRHMVPSLCTVLCVHYLNPLGCPRRSVLHYLCTAKDWRFPGFENLLLIPSQRGQSWDFTTGVVGIPSCWLMAADLG